ncbi:MAG: right-handed parallel beta-helix repeat-containing protein, partial [Ignavibacteriales bacterium]|nr:right-handed parallel beta-helix repeat-containing protein [Ignavibacteriales bacterium]
TYENAGSTTQSNIPVRLNIIPPSGNDYEDSDTIQSLVPGQSIQIVFNNFSPNSTGVHTVNAYSLLSTDQNTINDSLTSNFREAVLISGIFTVGDGGMIPTMREAVDTLNNNIISGDVTFSLINSEYNEPPLSIGPLDYSFLINLITFEPAVGVNPVVNINSTSSEPFGLAIMGASKIIINGSSPTEYSRNMTISANGINGKIGILIRGVEGAFADSNEVRNLNIRNGADSLLNSDEYYGVLLYGYNETYHDAGNIVYNCDIQKHGSTGIAVQWQDDAIIENNNIHNWVQKGEGNDIHGIWLADGATNTIVRNNVIGDIITKVNYSWAY